MKRVWIVLGLIVILVAGGWAYVTYVDPSLLPQTSESSVEDAEAGSQEQEDPELDSVIWASGKLLPSVWANLAPLQGGIVKTLHVKEGDWVEPGELLIQLENPTAESQVEISAATLAEAEAAHSSLLSGASEAEVAASEAGVATAEAQVSLAAGRLLEAQKSVEFYQVEVQIAREQYDELAAGPTEAERAAAAARVEVAQAALDHAQATYNAVRGDPTIGSTLLESLQLEQATKSLKAAQAEFAVATQGASEQRLAVARSRITEALSRVSVAESQIPAAEAGVQSAQAALASAQANLRRTREGASLEDIAVSLARIGTARAQLASAQAYVGQSQIVAPFSGQVGALLVRSGELVTPGQVLVLLGDTGSMHVETTDLRETDVVQLESGQKVEVTFDSLPDQIFDGIITHIAPVSTSDRGSTNFTVHVEVPQLDGNLRWGMTAFVNILVSPQ
ncbi:MAG: efflux RND transporter periplasmic adaptor subunit [Caldilineaceae bacterium]|nr:efflux RND transporter periplasmic adaptor subunit [Caldilineaceae bacterium]MDE0339812.1 efflux RND transporter periplasmic adaptor subunit [Caldilineaceae bacterium]